MSIKNMSNAQINEYFNMSTREEIMKEFDTGCIWDVIAAQAEANPKPCDENGVEFGASDVLTDVLTNVNEISEYTEEHALDLGDRIGDAELCNWNALSEIIYEQDFYDREVAARQMPVFIKEGKAFITKEQKELNLSFYLKKIEEAKSTSELIEIYKMVHFGIKESIRTFEIEEEVSDIHEGPATRSITAPTFFPAGETRTFEAAYREQKDKLSVTPEMLLVIHELEDLGKDCKRAWQLKVLKKEIYNANIPYKEKARLWAMCDHDIARLEAEAA